MKIIWLANAVVNLLEQMVHPHARGDYDLKKILTKLWGEFDAHRNDCSVNPNASDVERAEGKINGHVQAHTQGAHL